MLSSPDAAEPNFPVVCNNSGNVVPGTPELSMFVSANFVKEFGNNMEGYSQLDMSWRDDVVSGNDNDINKAQDSFSLVNFRIGVRIDDAKYDISLWGKNIFDEDYHGGGFNSVIREGSLTAYLTEPFTWGLTLRSAF
jgi:iron complex outermembrane receptor protein